MNKTLDDSIYSLKNVVSVVEKAGLKKWLNPQIPGILSANSRYSKLIERPPRFEYRNFLCPIKITRVML